VRVWVAGPFGRTGRFVDVPAIGLAADLHGAGSFGKAEQFARA
jgi:hypothetical protein